MKLKEKPLLSIMNLNEYFDNHSNFFLEECRNFELNTKAAVLKPISFKGSVGISITM